MKCLTEATCNAALGQYRHQGFKLYEKLDGRDSVVALILEYTPCKFQDKLPITGTRVSAVRNDCANHLTQCPAKQKDLITLIDKSRIKAKI